MLWNQVQKLSTNYLQPIYELYTNKNFPIEVRYTCAAWIEASVWKLSCEDFVQGLRNQLESKLQESQSQLLELGSSSAGNMPSSPSSIQVFHLFRLREFLDNQIGKIHFFNPYAFQKTVQECLKFEADVIRKYNSDQRNSINYVTTTDVTMLENDSSSFNPQRVITDDLYSVKNEIYTTWEKVKAFGKRLEEFQLCLQELQKIEGMIQQHEVNKLAFPSHINMSKQAENAELDAKFEERKVYFNTNLRNALNDLRDVQAFLEESTTTLIAKVQNCGRKVVQEDLSNWKLKQQKGEANIALESIQPLFDTVAGLAVMLRQMLGDAHNIQKNFNGKDIIFKPGFERAISKNMKEVTKFIKDFAVQSFVVKEQPSQVIKTNTRFPIGQNGIPLTVCFLIGKQLNLHNLLSPMIVTARIINEDQCKMLSKEGEQFLSREGSSSTFNKASLENNKVKLDPSTDSSIMSAIFRSISMRGIRRSEKKSAHMGSGKGSRHKDKDGNGHANGSSSSTEAVTDEKFAIVFETSFCMQDFENENESFNCKLWTLSLPLVVTSHGTQESQAWATIMWDNTFAVPGRDLFRVTDEGSWSHIRQLLNAKFTSLIGSGLTQSNLEFLAEKLGVRTSTGSIYDLKTISFASFAKDPMGDGREWSFWDWFYSAMKLVEKCLKDLWLDKRIYGFISKNEAERLLKECSPGTFLFRFSDSTKGAISIVWLHTDGKVWNLNPFNLKELTQQSLIDRIQDLNELHVLYPNIRKEDIRSLCDPISLIDEDVKTASTLSARRGSTASHSSRASLASSAASRGYVFTRNFTKIVNGTEDSMSTLTLGYDDPCPTCGRKGLISRSPSTTLSVSSTNNIYSPSTLVPSQLMSFTTSGDSSTSNYVSTRFDMISGANFSLAAEDLDDQVQQWVNGEGNNYDHFVPEESNYESLLDSLTPK